MRSSSALLFLILALAGQPLRQAEAASDFARSLTHFIVASGVIEIPDGGVGDDSGETVVKAETSHAVSAWCLSSGDPWASARGLSPWFVLALSPPDLGAPHGQQGHVSWLPSRASQRQAWLQVLQV